MDVCAALGEDRLNFIGFSYGTMLGALYADQFGETTGRMVLDGVLPPQLTTAEVTLGQAQGFEDALNRYVADCQEKSDCPVAGPDVGSGVKKIQDLLAGLDEKPLPAGDGEQLNQALAAGAILYYLYFPSSGDWDGLSEGLTDAFAGDGKKLLEMYRTRLERNSDGSYRNNSQEVFYAVNCLDRDSDVSADELAARAEEWTQSAPTFGRYLAWSEAACAEWPVAGEGEPRQVTASEAGPIVIIGNTHDPATPLPWAQRLAESMADAHLIVWDADGHTAYGNGSQCVQDAVDDYLVDGTLPPPDLVCQ
ncbi:MAG: alpha/beta hydrolase [Candidatus Nanopelagicales bacterium]